MRRAPGQAPFSVTMRLSPLDASTRRHYQRHRRSRCRAGTAPAYQRLPTLIYNRAIRAAHSILLLYIPYIAPRAKSPRRRDVSDAASGQLLPIGELPRPAGRASIAA
jgi:hypothetical protein